MAGFACYVMIFDAQLLPYLICRIVFDKLDMSTFGALLVSCKFECS